MKLTPDHRVRDLGQSILTLRKDLSITPRMDGGRPGYVIEDKVRSQYFRIGVPECTFISLLDGQTTVSEALLVTANVDPEYAFTEEQAAGICQWLIDNELATTTETAKRAPEKSAEEGQKWARWNPFFLRIPLAHPDNWVLRIMPWVSWLFSAWFSLLSLFLYGLALQQVCTEWTRFLGSARGVLAPERWLWLLGAWIVIKLIHEMGHSVVCKRYGGTVRESGVILILGMPLAYVDVTSSWRFRSKWRRIHTALGGMQIELLLASLAALIWAHIRPGLMSDLCCQIALMSSVATLAVNANPLMKFDGYYILSDLLDMPNLHSQGRQSVMHLVRKYLLGIESSLPDAPLWRRWIAGVYGVLSMIWRVIVCVGLAYAASRLLRGAGLIIAVMGLAMWLGPPTCSAVKFVLFGSKLHQPQRLRLLVTGGGLVGAIALAAAFLPSPFAQQAPCIVDFAESAIVRATGPGFVREMKVAAGQAVVKNQVLALMENDELTLEVHDLQLQTQAVARRMRDLLHERDLSDYQAEREKLHTLEDRLRERQEELDGMIVRAPCDGRVVGRDLNSMVGAYIQKGAELMVIGDEHDKELRVSISQQDLDTFSASVNRLVKVRIHGQGKFYAKLAQVEPRGSLLPNATALCAPQGGPLAVRSVTQSEDAQEEVRRYELLAPRFEGVVALDSRHSPTLVAGQRGWCSIRSGMTIAEQVMAAIRRQGR